MVPCPIGDTLPEQVLPVSCVERVRGIDYFIVENLRSARRFLSSLKMGRPIETLFFAELNEHTPPHEVESLLKPLLEGHDAGMVSEAGVPGVADPGAELAALCHARGIRVVPLVGPSSILMALMASGLNGQSFAFNGYLPVKPDERRRAISRLEKRASAENQSQIFMETPYRNLKMFADILAVCRPQTLLTVAADVTSPGEYIFTAPVSEWRRMPLPDIDKRPAVFIIL